MSGLTRQLGAFVAALRYEVIPPELFTQLRNGFTDYAAVTLLGRNDDVTRALRAVLAPGQAQGEARLCFGAARSNGPDAALISGAASHAQDYDDVGLVGVQPTHPSAAIAPAIFAEAETLGRDGRAMLTAYAAAFEVWGDLAARESDPPHVKGWHPTGTFGAIAAAAASAHLRGLDEARAAHALGIAASMAAGFIANFGSMTKPFHAGRAAQSGVLAARLAEAGMTASPDALESPVGFLAAISPKGAVDRASVPRCGERWFLATHGLGFKLFPMCYGAHRALDGLFTLLGAQPVTAEEVESIEVHATRLQFANLVHDNPQNGLDAKFSMEFAMAAPIIAGRVTEAEFTSAFVQRADVRALMGRVRRVYLPPPDKGAAPHDKIMLRLRDGRPIEQMLRAPMGHADRPPTAQALWTKFADCVGDALTPSDARRLFDQLQHLDQLASLNDLPVAAA